ncbi:uncharacterized protein LOC130793663 [Actinidia eriantha]|uniref:uncharacterized protein LOC130793663 n=1 Tax=Actinidia eriantha TaxID=165200 RepID=UPI002588ED9F|nr:uncharacterized protein LOC130793663 [Actinidia eriantha]
MAVHAFDAAKAGKNGKDLRDMIEYWREEKRKASKEQSIRPKDPKIFERLTSSQFLSHYVFQYCQTYSRSGSHYTFKGTGTHEGPHLSPLESLAPRSPQGETSWHI